LNNWGGTAIIADDTLFFAGSTRLDNNNDTSAGTTYSNLTFNAGAGTFVLSGNPITLAAGAGNITNNSSNPQTVNLGLDFSSGFTLNGGSAGLTMGEGLTNTLGASGTTTLTLAGTGTLTNLLNSTTSPGGTNVIALNNASADWTLANNPSSTQITVPWVLAVTNGTFNFGNAGSAPVLTLLTTRGAPSDNYVTASTGNTGTFNMVSGILTNSARFDTGIGGTGNINVSGGLWVMNDQLQQANASPGFGNVNVSGGTLSVNNSQTLFIASRGTGSLTVDGSGTVNCGTLDVSRTASAGSQGTVNLNSGGTLQVSVTITTASNAAGATNGTEKAILNFNGGTLQAGVNSTTWITEGAYDGNTASNVVLNLIVKSGGAIINSAGFSVTNTLSLQHDSSLGATPDGGLTKNSTGTLALSAANTYSGDTIISGGTLALSGSGSVDDSAAISVASGARFDVSSVTSGYTLAGGQTLTGSGVVTGAVTTASSAVLSPGNSSIGTLSFSNSLTLNALSTNEFAVTPSGGASNKVVVAGLLTPNNSVVSVTAGAQLQPGTNTLFTYGSVSGSFNATPVFDVAPVHAAEAAIVDNGAGQITLVVPNHAPVAGATFTLPVTLGAAATIQIVGGKYAPTDADGDTLIITSVSGAVNGTVTTDGTNVTYTATSGTTDSFSYTVSDGYGGTAVGTVNVVINSSVAAQQGQNQLSVPQMINGNVVLSYLGIPGYTYALDWTHSLSTPITWLPLLTNAAAGNGALNFTNTPSGGSDYYRTRYVP